MTPNVVAMPGPGSDQTAGTFATGFINPPIVPPISDTRGTIVAAMLDELAGFQIKLFQDLFLIPQAPNQQKEAFAQTGSIEQMEAILQDVNSIKATVLAINQITNTAANRIPAGASINTNPNYSFLDNTVVDACNTIANDIIFNQSVQQAQLDYPTLQGLLNPIYGF